MENYIDQFMWGYQKVFYVSYKSFAEKTFNALAPHLFNQVYVLGFLAEGETDRNQICIEQEGEEFNQEMFSTVENLSAELEKVSVGKHILHSHPIAQKNHEVVVNASAWRDAIIKCNETLDLLKNRKTFVSASLRIEKYNIYLVLQLNKEVYDSIPKFSNTTLGRIHIYASILDALIPLFFTSIRKELNWDPTGMDSARISEKDLIRQAGKDFIDGIGIKCEHYEHLCVLNKSFNEISKTKYESSEAAGVIIFAPRNHQNVKVLVNFEKSIEITNIRLVRKMLELTNSDMQLLCDGFYIYGLGKVINSYNPTSENLFVIKFEGYNEWELLHNEVSFLRYKDNQPKVPVSIFDKALFVERVKQAMHDNITDEQIESMYSYVSDFSQHRKGAVLAFCSKAAKEAERLGNQAIPVIPQKYDESIIKTLASIDGAILMDNDCNCHAIGVILDGIATADKGDSARGARYNSSVRYYETNKDDTDLFVIVISEDGMMNFIPALMPRIPKAVPVSLLQQLKQISEQDDINVGEFNKIMDLISNLSFYLNQQQCDTTNSLRKEIEEKIKKNHPDQPMIVFKDFVPNPDFNESYLEK